MTLPPVLLLGVLCFGAGWGLDVWLGCGGEEKNAVPRGKFAALARGPVSEKPAALSQATAQAGTDTSSAKTFTRLLHLVRRVPYATGRAQAERAIAQFSLAEMQAAAGEVRAWLTSHPDKSLPAQITDPLVQRWLTLAPLEAMRLCADFPAIPVKEYFALLLKTMADQVTDHPAEVAPLLKKFDFEKEWAAYQAGMKDVSPQEILEVMNGMATRPGWNESTSWGNLPERWMTEDPERAMAHALALPANDTRRKLLRRMAEAWGARDGQAALSYLSAVPLSVLPEGPLRSDLKQLIQNPKPDPAELLPPLLPPPPLSEE